MNLYHCAIDLREGVSALAFARAIENWMVYLVENGGVRSWRLLRRKLNLAADSCRDFLLEIEVDDLAQLDHAFNIVGGRSEAVDRLYGQITPMIARVEYGLYRPFPDPHRSERVALL
jgi:hypothetical protein